MPKPILLIVDDDPQFLAALSRSLRREYDVRGAKSQQEAMEMLSPPPDVALIDLRLNESDPEDQGGLDVLQVLHQQFPQLPVLLITAHGDVDTAVECMRLGAADFIQKPRARGREIQARLEQALKHARLSRRATELEQELHLIEPRTIIGQAPTLQDIKRMINAVATDGDVTVLIRGETGTGKELIARAIHANGARRSGPFVPVTWLTDNSMIYMGL